MVLYYLLTPLVLALLGYSTNDPALFGRASICVTIQDIVSPDLKVYFPTLNESEYSKGIQHWAGSSTQKAECVVEPSTALDVAKILKILGSTRTPFAVKGGGHATNPGFSSTVGAEIALSRILGIDYNETEQTVTVGAGHLWDDVYAALEPHGVNVLGGRVSGIGVAGFTLGGGYSWKANQHGLTIDTVVAFELVKPDGTILRVTNEAEPDLFLGLKGGSNNFGIVTSFTFKTFPQTQVWGGLILANGSQADQIAEATAEFSANVQDPKAQIIVSYNFFQGQPILASQLFYDAPNPPSGVFDKFMNVSSLMKDVKTRDFLDFVQSSPTNATANQRAIFHTAPIIDHTPALLKAVLNQTTFWGQEFMNEAEPFVSYAVEPFLPDILAHTSQPSAYPADRSIRYTPLNVYFAWADKGSDDRFHNAIKQSVNQLRAAAIDEGQQIEQAPLYPNYAIYDTPVEKIYGDNIPRLQTLKKIHDPDNVMGLAGGFKI